MSKIDEYRKKTAKNSSYIDYISLSLKAYRNYKLSEDPNELVNATLIAQEGYNLYPSYLRLLLLCAFFYIEIDAYSDAKDIIDRLKSFRGYYKNNDMFAYIAHAYLSARYEIKMKNTKAVPRHIKRIERHNFDYCDLFLGHIYYELGDYQKSLQYLEESHKKGCRSFLIYILYGLSSVNEKNADYLFLPYIKWRLRKGLAVEDIIEQKEGLALLLAKGYLRDFMQVYESTGSALLLTLICEQLIKNRDTTKTAFKYYKISEHRQLQVKGISQLLIICARIYGDEDVNAHTLRTFLSENKMDEDNLPFILHLVLTNDQLKGFIDEFGLSDLILRAGEWAIENSKNGRIYNSIYRFMMENSPEHLDKLELLVYRDLFLANVEISNADGGYLYVYEEEKQNMEVYEFSGVEKQIPTVAGNLRIDIADKNTGKIIDTDYKVCKQVENADAWLYKYYISRGYNDPALHMALSGIYIKSENPSQEHIDILSKTLEINSLSTSFRMRLGGELGNILSILERHDKALEYFNKVDENHLDQRYIGTMLVAFINSFDFKKAAGLILKKREYINDRVLLWALKEMADDYRNDMYSLIADAAYELLIKNWYDAKLLNIVIKYYVGGNEDWYLLRDSLAAMGLYNIDLDKKILTNCLWVRDFSEASQAVFNRLYTNEKEKELTGNYIYYACYEIIVCVKRPVYEFIVNLEEHFIKTNQPLLAYALSTLYLKFSIATFKSNEILQKTIDIMECESVLMPIFKECKEIDSLYVNKHWPFIYTASAGSVVFLHYKVNDGDEYNKISMKPLFFDKFCAIIPLFYNEKVEYYFSQSKDALSVDEPCENSEILTAVNSCGNLQAENDDMYSIINRALINEKNSRHMEVERAIFKLLKETPQIRGRLL